MNPPRHAPEEVLGDEGDSSSSSPMTRTESKIRTISVSSATEAAGTSSQERSTLIHPQQHQQQQHINTHQPRLFPRHPLRSAPTVSLSSATAAPRIPPTASSAAAMPQEEETPDTRRSSPLVAVTPASSAASSATYRGRKRRAAACTITNNSTTTTTSTTPHTANAAAASGGGGVASTPVAPVPVKMISFSASSSTATTTTTTPMETPQERSKVHSTPIASGTSCSGGQRVVPSAAAAAYRTPSPSPAVMSIEQQQSHPEPSMDMLQTSTTADDNDDDSSMKPPALATPLATSHASTHSAITTTSSWLSTPQQQQQQQYLQPPQSLDFHHLPSGSLLAGASGGKSLGGVTLSFGKDSPSVTSTNSGFLEGVAMQGLALHSPQVTPARLVKSFPIPPASSSSIRRNHFTHDGSSPFATPFGSPAAGGGSSGTTWMTANSFKAPPSSLFLSNPVVSALETPPYHKKAPLRVLTHPSMMDTPRSRKQTPPGDGPKSRHSSTPTYDPTSRYLSNKSPSSFRIESPVAERTSDGRVNAGPNSLFCAKKNQDAFGSQTSNSFFLRKAPLTSVTLGHAKATTQTNKDRSSSFKLSLDHIPDMDQSQKNTPMEKHTTEISSLTCVQSTPLSQADISFIPLPNWNDDSPPAPKHQPSRTAAMSLFRSDMPDPIDQLFAREQAGRNVDEESLSDDENGQNGEEFLLVSPRDIGNDPMEHHEEERPTKHRRKCPPLDETMESQNEDTAQPLPRYDEHRAPKPLPVLNSRDLITPPVMSQSLSPPPLLPSTHFE